MRIGQVVPEKSHFELEGKFVNCDSSFFVGRVQKYGARTDH